MMKNLKQILLSIAFVCSTLAWGQSKALQEIKAEYDSGFSLFFYQSTLRMLHKNPEGDFNKLIKDLDHIHLFYLQKNEI
jgi:hypothetical protein